MDKYHYDILEDYQDRLLSIWDEMKEYQETGVKYADYTQYQKRLYKASVSDLYDMIDYIGLIASNPGYESILCTAIERIANGSFVDDSIFPSELSDDYISLYSFKAVLYEIVGGKIVTREINFDESYTENINRTVIEAEMFCKTCIVQNLKAFIMFQLKTINTDAFGYNYDKRIEEHRKENPSCVRFPYTVTIRWIKTVFDGLSDEDKKAWSDICRKEIQKQYSSRWLTFLNPTGDTSEDLWNPVELYFDFQYKSVTGRLDRYDELIRIYKKWKNKLGDKA